MSPVSFRTAIHAILNRLGVDTLVGRMSRVREDHRFKTVAPEDIILTIPTPSSHLAPGSSVEESDDVEIWFDFAFVDFWKSNYCEFVAEIHSYSSEANTCSCKDTVQRAITLDPDTLNTSDGTSLVRVTP